MAVAMCAPPPLLPSFAVVAASAANDSDRFYKFGTPSPPSVPEYSPPSCYSELEESGFHSDEEMQKVRDVCECLVNVWGGAAERIHGAPVFDRVHFRTGGAIVAVAPSVGERAAKLS